MCNTVTVQSSPVRAEPCEDKHEVGLREPGLCPSPEGPESGGGGVGRGRGRCWKNC